MNWKTLLVAASLSLSAGLTACNQAEKAPEAGTDPKPAESAAPAATETKPMESKAPDAGAKTDAKPEAGKSPEAAKSPAAGAKTDAKPTDAPKKP
jgi:hypothetical protein